MNFINWRELPAMPGTKPRKMPCGPDGSAIDHLDPLNWLTESDARATGYHVAVVLPRVSPDHAAPVDFLLDLDACRDPATGAVEPWAQMVLAQFPGAWCEVSHSGTGFHIMGQCVPAALGDRRNKFTPPGAPHNAAEFYFSGRFVALGQGGAGDWRDWTDTLARVVPERETVQLPDATDTVPLDYSGPDNDDALIEMMRDERRRAGGDLAPGVFAADFFGDVGIFRARAHTVWGYDPAKPAPFDFDGSSADYSLMNHLAHYTGGDVARMERLHARSVMGQREKAQRRPEYIREAAARPAAEARAAGRYLNRPTVESVLRQIQHDPISAPDSLGPVVACMSPDDRAAVLEGCKAFGCKRDMQAALKTAQAEQARTVGAERVAMASGGPLAPFYIVRNYDGAAVVLDERGGMQPQSRAAFRDAMSDLPPVPFVTASGSVSAQPAVDAWWTNPATPRYDAVGYMPGQPLDCSDASGRRIRNIYTAPHGPAVPVGPEQAEPWLKIIRANFPDAGDQQTLITALAWMVQNPGGMLRWAPVMQGAPGCGKGSIAEAVAYAHGREHVSHPTPDTIGTDFNGFMWRKTLVVVDEIGDHTKRELSALAEKLKPWITDNAVEVVRKGKDGQDVVNTCSWIFTTNHAHCMLATVGERRYAHFISALQTDAQVASAFPDMWLDRDYRAWVDAGGLELVRGYLSSLDVSGVPSRAPQTTSTAAAVAASESELAVLVREAVASGEPGFRGGFVSLNALAAVASVEGVKLPAGRFVARQLAGMGYSESVRVNTSVAESMRFPGAGAKSRLYFNPALTKAERYDAAQDSAPSGVVVPFRG